MIQKVLKWAPRVIAAIILLQTLLFKFGIGGAESLQLSQDLFSKLSLEVLGDPSHEATLRIGTGIMEMVASILMLIPRSAWFGGLMGVGAMSGAILSHLFFLGIKSEGTGHDDGGMLFIMAIVTLILCTTVVIQERTKVPVMKKFFA